MGALLQFDRRIINMRDPANPEAMEWTKKNLILLPTDTVIYGRQDIELKSAYSGNEMEPVSDGYSDNMLEWVDE